MHAKKICQRIFEEMDIKINGKHPWDIQVNDKRLYKRLLFSKDRGSLALGESYIEGWWDVKELDEFFYRISKNFHKIKIRDFKIVLQVFKNMLLNSQSKRRSKQVAKEHYDLGNKLYENMLDKEYMQYTCGYWKKAKNLQQAQIDKLDLICKKLNLSKKSSKKPKEKILELGSGFGGFALYATRFYNCEVTTYNISKEQVEYAKKKSRGLPINIIKADYRDAGNPKHKEYFDKIVSIGMCEHVGPKNYMKFMKIAYDNLKDTGLFLMHTIGNNKTIKPHKGDFWIRKYIFPGGHLPSPTQILKASEGLFRIEDLHNFGRYYDNTLMAWFKNFNKNWSKLKQLYDDKFYRLWKYYLLSCAGGFRSGSMSLYQFVFSKGNLAKTYSGVR